jgi:hypothetical protein
MSIDPDAIAPRHDGSRHRRRPRKFYRKWWFWLLVVVVLVIIAIAAVAAWVGTRALEAKSELESALPLASEIQEKVLAGDAEGAAATAAKMAEHTGAARVHTNDPVWRAVEFLPVAGVNLAAVRQMSDIADDLANDAIVPLSGLAPLLQGSTFKPVNGAIDLAPIIAAKETVNEASASVTSSLERLRAIDKKPLVDQVSSAAGQLDTLLATYEPTLISAKELIAVIPDAMGASGPRDYLLVFQNNTEVMPRGGTVGSLVDIHVDAGRIELGQQASPLAWELGANTVIPIAQDEQDLWIGLGKNMQNLTETPRFSLSYDIAREMWKEKFGVEISGLISLDPVALSYIVTATGPITLPDGGVLTGDTLVKGLMSDVYVKYPNPLDQDAYYQAIVSTTFGAITAGNFDPMALFNAILTGANQKRVLMWTSNPAEQALLAGSPFQGEPISSTETTEGIGVYFRDYTPSKMAFYLTQSVKVTQASCPATDTHKTRVTVTLANNITPEAAKALPKYVSLANTSTGIKRGDILLGIKVYGPEGSAFVGGQSNSKYAVSPGSDRTFSVGQTRTQLSPGQNISSTYDFVAPGAAIKTQLTDISPVVSPTEVIMETVDCAAF